MKKFLTFFACLVFALSINTSAQVATINVLGKDVNGLDVSLDSIIIFNVTRGWVEVSDVPTVSYEYSNEGVDEFSVVTDATVAPNPANGRTFIDVKMGRGEMVNVDVFDITGRKEAMFSSNLEEGNNRLELRLKNIGLHIVKISSAYGSKVVKVVNQTEGDENVVSFVGNRSNVTKKRRSEKEIWYGDNILVQGYAISCDGKAIESQAVDTFITTTNSELIVQFTVGVADCVKGVSVSDSVRVVFAKSNLQYKQCDTWRFAENPWDYIGDDNENISEKYFGGIDLFGWGTGNNPTKYSVNDTYNPFFDWGDYCELPTPEGTTGKWRTLTIEEWRHVMFERATSSGVRYAMAQVNGYNGIIILPDDWNTATFSLNSTNIECAYYNTNIISGTLWSIVLEPAGCVFLPAAGARNGSDVRDPAHGHYWSSTSYGSGEAYEFHFDDNQFCITTYSNSRYFGYSVRLVADVK